MSSGLQIKKSEEGNIMGKAIKARSISVNVRR